MIAGQIKTSPASQPPNQFVSHRLKSDDRRLANSNTCGERKKFSLPKKNRPGAECSGARLARAHVPLATNAERVARVRVCVCACSGAEGVSVCVRVLEQHV